MSEDPRSLSEERSDEAKRALWVVPVSDLAGVARHVLDTTRVGLPGWDITVLCAEGPLAERLRAQQAHVIAAPFGPDSGIRSSRKSLTAAVREVQPEIVHSHLAYADIISAITPMPDGARRFTTEHGIAGDDGVYHRSSMQAKVMARVHRWRFRRFSGVIAVSRATRDAMIAKWRVKQGIAVIPNGVDLPEGVTRRDPSSVTGMRILSLSRLAPEKRIDKLIEAFALVRAEHPSATLTVAGEGPLRADLEAVAARTGVREGVTFPGFVNPEQAMGDADVVVQLSVWENCSYTLLDAAARGVRVVATDVGGNSEIVDQASLVKSTLATEVAQAIGRVGLGPAPAPLSVVEMGAMVARKYEAELGNG